MKQRTIILFLLCTCLVSISQKNITTDVPCTDVMDDRIPGLDHREFVTDND